MKIYILSSRRNEEFNRKITEYLESKGHVVYLPKRDTPQDSVSEVYRGNTLAIVTSDLILAIAKGHVTQNWAFELGYSLGLGKDIFCMINQTTDIDQFRMVKGGIEKTRLIHTIEELENLL